MFWQKEILMEARKCCVVRDEVSPVAAIEAQKTNHHFREAVWLAEGPRFSPSESCCTCGS